MSTMQAALLKAGVVTDAEVARLKSRDKLKARIKQLYADIGVLREALYSLPFTKDQQTIIRRGMQHGYGQIAEARSQLKELEK